MTHSEQEKLQQISQRSIYSAGVMEAAIAYCFRILRRHLKGGHVLELGPAEGLMTDHLNGVSENLTIVEGSSLFCDDLRKRFPDATVVNSLFEEFDPNDRFDTIVMGHVLEHVEDPGAILTQARNWLAPNGNIFAAVPNARSLHRQAAVVMGMLPSENSLNERDILHGHRRVFDPELFRSAFYQAGLTIDLFGGYWLKPVSNGQIEESWSPAMVDSFMQLGERYPDIAGEIYIVASVADTSES
ncbi:MAG: class I SAM-dependent methyltransferase [Parvibaculaceae bacterium]